MDDLSRTRTWINLHVHLSSSAYRHVHMGPYRHVHMGPYRHVHMGPYTYGLISIASTCILKGMYVCYSTLRVRTCTFMYI